MARPREPINLVIAKGKKNLTKAEIKERQSNEVQPCVDGITPPSHLTSSQKKRFDKLAGQLQKIKIMGETDCDTLARYVVVQETYEQAVRDLRNIERQRPKGEAATLEALLAWTAMLEKLDKRVERYFKQAQSAARELGLTISSRCKLQVPVKEEPAKVNKFDAFGMSGQKGGDAPHVPMH